MTELIFIAILAVLLLGAAFLLVRSNPSTDSADLAETPNLAEGLWEDSSLSLAERIFNPEDYNWVREELSFPQAAHSLAKHRKELAVSWLQALRKSFKEFVAMPEASSPADPLQREGSWQLLWQAFRFHLLISYALIVVRLFGPYHRLVPYFGWLRAMQKLRVQNLKAGIAGADRIH